LAQLVELHNIKPPALIVIGDVVQQFSTQQVGKLGYFKASTAVVQQAAG